ncbi:MAG: YolD-like family protein [Lachnospiraceae bacterium]|nr:YolD-like family protein [Lachnospiraceae bacterium]
MAHRPKYPMPVSQRAKIFAPFDALRGFGAALRAKEKICQPRKLLLEDKLEELNLKASELKKGDPVSVLYYSDGDYLTVLGFLSDIDLVGRSFVIAGKEIGFDDIYDLNAEIEKHEKN